MFSPYKNRFESPTLHKSYSSLAHSISALTLSVRHLTTTTPFLALLAFPCARPPRIRLAAPSDGEPARAVPQDPQHPQGHVAAGNPRRVQEPRQEMAPRQAPAVVQARGRGALQGHQRGLRGAPGPAGEQGGVRAVQRRPRGREGRRRRRRRRPRRRRRAAHGQDAQRRLLREERARHAGEGVQEGVQLRQLRRAARLRGVLQLHHAQGGAAGAQARVHPGGALPRLQEGGQVHPRRRHQERVNCQEGGEPDGGGEARVEEREAGGVRRHGRRAAGLPARGRHLHGVGEEAPDVQARGRRPGAQGGGAAGARAHRLVLLVPAAQRPQGDLLVPGRGHLPRLREGHRRRRHAHPRAQGRLRARRPQGQVRHRLPQGAHRRAARWARRDPQRDLLNGRTDGSIACAWWGYRINRGRSSRVSSFLGRVFILILIARE